MNGYQHLPPWLNTAFDQALQQQRGHALLLHGAAGVGQFEMGLALAQAWLCDQPTANQHPCGQCASCHLFEVRTHPDLRVLVPEALRESLGWNAQIEEEKSATDKPSKTKPSKEIKVDAVRQALQFALSTPSRSARKVILMYPAEAMNTISANALLKTLEEPTDSARLVLISAAPDRLLPTLRSRCQAVRIALPPAETALAWLREQGLTEPDILLAAAGGSPQEALQWHKEGLQAAHWRELPKQVIAGQAGTLLGQWPLPRVVQTLQKLCHDCLSQTQGAIPRYFSSADLPPCKHLMPLVEWAKALQRAATQAEHPWNAPLALDAWIHQAQQALRLSQQEKQHPERH
jgi:DNA polymerase III subunit delta'